MKFEDLKKQVTDPDVRAYLNSYQYNLSLAILGARVSKGYTDFQTAHALGMTYQQYLKLEHGSVDQHLTKAKYEATLKQINDLPQASPKPKIWVATAKSPEETATTYFHTQRDAIEYLANKYPLPTKFIPSVPMNPNDIELGQVYCDITDNFDDDLGTYQLVIYRHGKTAVDRDQATAQDLEKLELELPLETYVHSIEFYD